MDWIFELFLDEGTEDFKIKLKGLTKEEKCGIISNDDEVDIKTSLYLKDGMWNYDVTKNGETSHYEYSTVEELFEEQDNYLLDLWEFKEKAKVEFPLITYLEDEECWFIHDINYKSTNMDYIAKEAIDYLNPEISSVREYNELYNTIVKYLQSIKETTEIEEELYSLLN